MRAEACVFFSSPLPPLPVPGTYWSGCLCLPTHCLPSSLIKEPSFLWSVHSIWFTWLWPHLYCKRVAHIRVLPEAFQYEIQGGDSLLGLAKLQMSLGSHHACHKDAVGGSLKSSSPGRLIQSFLIPQSLTDWQGGAKSDRLASRWDINSGVI